jgi:hypothetical protein
VRNARSVAEEEERKIYWVVANGLNGNVGLRRARKCWRRQALELLRSFKSARQKFSRCEGHARGGEQEKDCELTIGMSDCGRGREGKEEDRRGGSVV